MIQIDYTHFMPHVTLMIQAEYMRRWATRYHVDPIYLRPNEVGIWMQRSHKLANAYLRRYIYSLDNQYRLGFTLSLTRRLYKIA